MQKVIINQDYFKKIIDSAKFIIDKNDTREALRYIQLKVDGNHITAYSCNGYQASKITVECNTVDEAKFTCYIKPFTVKKSKSGVDEVTIEMDGNRSYISIKTEFGEMRYGFDKPNSEFFDVEKVFKQNEEHDREIGVDSCRLIRSLMGVSSVTDDRFNIAVIETKENKLQPFIIRAKQKWGEVSQLILPVRYNGGE